MKMKLLFKFVILAILITTTNVAIAQYSDDYGYNEDDYDGDYEYNSYNNSYYQRGTEDEYRKRQERFYKKSYEEEDLYNGGYRRKNYSSSQNYYGIGGLNMGGINPRSNSWFGGNDDDESTPVVKPRNIDGLDNREAGISDGNDQLGGDGKGGVTTKADPNQGKEINPRDEKKTETAPPPPDEPDIPVDTAIPFLIAAGLLIATLKLNKIKNALVN